MNDYANEAVAAPHRGSPGRPADAAAGPMISVVYNTEPMHMLPGDYDRGMAVIAGQKRSAGHCGIARMGR